VPNELTGLPFLIWISVAKQKTPPGLSPCRMARRCLLGFLALPIRTPRPQLQLQTKVFLGTIHGTGPYLFRGWCHPEFNRMQILPVDRALSIYGALADRSETKGARKRLSEHLMKKYIEGEKDVHRLTVEGLLYLHNLNREIDSRR
jgi:hypothetical protein